MRVMGIDYGAARAGVALGDTETGIATPWKVLLNQEHEALVAQVIGLAQQEGAGALVVGVPRPLRDTGLENAQVQEVRKFIDALRAAGATVEEWDEAFSSQVAAGYEQSSRAQTAAGRPKMKGAKRDDMAAAVLLEGWLNHHAVSP